LEFVFLVFGILIFGILSKDNNIKNYSAADIEKYHKGLLSAKERNDLEKAALDDPFLADALEGYAVAGVDHAADIDVLKKRLAEKVESGKVIAMKGGGKTSFPWLRVAALVIVIAGAGLLAKQLIFNNHSKDIAQAEPKKAEETKTNDTANTVTITSETDTVKIKSGTFDNQLNQTNRSSAFTPKDNTPVGSNSKEASGQGKVTTTDVTVTSNATQPVITAPAKIEDEKINQFKKVAAGNADKKEIAKEEVKDKIEINNKKDYERDEVKGLVSQPGYYDKQKNRAVAPSRQLNDQGYRNQATNTFRGRVTDASNVGVPFANVTNAQDNNAGTYTDAKGYFNLTYPDTVLTVQVKSIGFENTNVQLRNYVTSNQVVMQDDRSLATFTLPNADSAKRRLIAKIKLEEPEPADGWDNYDTYIVNNLNPPDEIKTRQNSGGQVEVSFEVDKNGNPINIKVEKSLCSKCDQEAIRLIKEGPKWKRHAKKGRTTVTVPFNNSL
jgi:TonB family protein